MRLSGHIRGIRIHGDSERLYLRLRNALTDAGAEGVRAGQDGVTFVFCTFGVGQSPVHLGPGRFSLDSRDPSLISYQVEYSLLATFGPLVFICPVVVLVALFLGVHWAIVLLVLFLGSAFLLWHCSSEANRWLDQLSARVGASGDQAPSHPASV